MLTIILDWFYILFTTFCMGFAFSCFAEKALHYRLRRMESVIVAGLVAAGVYAQVFSLFYRVGLEANVLLVLACLAACIVLGRRMRDFLGEVSGNRSLMYGIGVLLLFLAWSYFTSRGYLVPDMDIYHGQSIRWIEEYGAVKGLGLLHNRFGYNSSIFAVSALYGMRFLGGPSLHGVNGLIAFVLSVMALDLGKCFSRKKMLLPDYARVAAVYYLTTIWDEVIAPSSDYAVMCIIFFIVIRWLELLEEDKGQGGSIAPYGLLCVAGVYALTLKLTAGLILLLVIKPAYRLLKEKRWKEIGIYLALGLAVAVPWMARTVIITGWLFYPFTALDLFDVDWKMTDLSVIESDAYLIKIWAKGANQLADGNRLGVWFPHWFRNVLSPMEKLLVAADGVSCVITLGMAVTVFVKRQWKRLDMLLVLGTVLCCYLFWLFSAPMMRYGYAHVLLLAALAGGCLLERFRIGAKVFYGMIAVYGAYKLCVGLVYIESYSWGPYYIWQRTYEKYEVESYAVDGVTLYYSPYMGPTGYDAFPSAPTRAEGIELRGEGLRDGFRLKQDGNTD